MWNTALAGMEFQHPSIESLIASRGAKSGVAPGPQLRAVTDAEKGVGTPPDWIRADGAHARPEVAKETVALN